MSETTAEELVQLRDPGRCALSPFRRKFVMPDGQEIVRDVSARQVAWGKAQSHIGENVGSTGTHVLVIELK